MREEGGIGRGVVGEGCQEEEENMKGWRKAKIGIRIEGSRRWREKRSRERWRKDVRGERDKRTGENEDKKNCRTGRRRIGIRRWGMRKRGGRDGGRE